ncbi:MAG: monovalent cation/H+ antiporter subunit D [Spirochaetales bacterium]|nr:monovalent cation/H+ antiporter subunit D [Spirochaetales bacterium]
MNDLVILPIILPLATGILLVFLAGSPQWLQRGLALLATLTLAAGSLLLLELTAEGQITVYNLSNWPARFGIILVADRLSSLMVLLVSAIALPALLFAMDGSDSRGRYFHALFQFQLVGVNGAFLTGDLFNLFVFFEVLLISSYSLLLHGGKSERVRMGIRFVFLNLIGSGIFLMGITTLYGLTGSLNMADLATQIARLPAQDQFLARAAGLVLFIVFALKAALLPLGFWLPHTYGVASTAVASLFAIMTKVGVYAILRIFTLFFGPASGALSGYIWPVVTALAALTLILGTLGALGSRRLRGLQGQLLLASVGTMLLALSIHTLETVAAGLYYMVHSTIAVAAFYLVSGLLSAARSEDDQLTPGKPLPRWGLLGFLTAIVAMTVAGLPPLSGFLGKLLLLSAMPDTFAGYGIWTLVLVCALLILVALSRAISILFWKMHPAQSAGPEISNEEMLRTAGAIKPVQWLAIGLHLLFILSLSVGADRAYQLTVATAAQTLEPAIYIKSVLGAAP